MNFKIKKIPFLYLMRCVEGSDEMANNINPDQTAPKGVV